MCVRVELAPLVLLFLAHDLSFFSLSFPLLFFSLSFCLSLSQKFLEYCSKAFKVLRIHANLLESLFGLMVAAGMPELIKETDIYYMRDKLLLHEKESKAQQKLNEEIENSLDSKYRRFDNFIRTTRRHTNAATRRRGSDQLLECCLAWRSLLFPPLRFVLPVQTTCATADHLFSSCHFPLVPTFPARPFSLRTPLASPSLLLAFRPRTPSRPVHRFLSFLFLCLSLLSSLLAASLFAFCFFLRNSHHVQSQALPFLFQQATSSEFERTESMHKLAAALHAASLCQLPTTCCTSSSSSTASPSRFAAVHRSWLKLALVHELHAFGTRASRFILLTLFEDAPFRHELERSWRCNAASARTAHASDRSVAGQMLMRCNGKTRRNNVEACLRCRSNDMRA